MASTRTTNGLSARLASVQNSTDRDKSAASTLHALEHALGPCVPSHKIATSTHQPRTAGQVSCTTLSTHVPAGVSSRFPHARSFLPCAWVDKVRSTKQGEDAKERRNSKQRMGRTPDAIYLDQFSTRACPAPFGMGTAPFRAGSGVRGKAGRSMRNKAQSARLCTRVCRLIGRAPQVHLVHSLVHGTERHACVRDVAWAGRGDSPTLPCIPGAGSFRARCADA